MSVRRLWRLPSQTLAQVAVENGSANLQHAMRAFECPLHLLLLHHSPGDKGIDSGLSERGSNPSAGSVACAVIDDGVSIRANVGEQGLCEIEEALG